MTTLTELPAIARPYRARIRLGATAAFGDPAARVLGMPRGADGYARYERIRARGDLVRGRSGLCMTASHAVCKEVLRSERFLAAPTSAVRLNLAPLPWQQSGMLVHPLDDSLASEPGSTEPHQAAQDCGTAFIEEVVHRQLDQLDRKEPVDLIDEFALQVPSKVICELLGLSPDDHFLFARWGTEFGATVDGARGMGYVTGIASGLCLRN